MVDLLQQRRVERTGNRTAAQQRAAKANALLVGEAQHFDGEGQALALLVQRMHAFNRSDHPEHAIVFAGIAYRVEMRAEHQARRPRSVAFITTDAVADLVELGAHAGIAHPAQHEIAGGTLFLAQEDTRQSIGLLGAAGQCLTVLPDPQCGGKYVVAHRMLLPCVG